MRTHAGKILCQWVCLIPLLFSWRWMIKLVGKSFKTKKWEFILYNHIKPNHQKSEPEINCIKWKQNGDFHPINNINTFNFIVGAHPSFSLISVLSELRPRTPSGPGMWCMGMLLFSKLRTISAISFMLTISSLPIFTGSRKSDLVNLNRKVNQEHNVKFYQRIRTNQKTDIKEANIWLTWYTPNFVSIYNQTGKS